MNDRQLRYACAVWRERGFSRAAEKLNVSQPSLSDQVRLLEEEIGFELFYRGGRGIEPSVNGRAFLEAAERIVEDLAGLKEFGSELRGKAGTRLRIGVSSGIAQTMIPLIVGGLKHISRKIYPEITTATSRRVQRLVSQHRLDLAILFENKSSRTEHDLVTEPLTSSEIVLLAPLNHTLGKIEGPLTLSEIASYPLIVSEPRLGYGRHIIERFTLADLEPNIVADCDDAESLKYMVHSGAGVGLIPRFALQYEAIDTRFKVFPLDPSVVVGIHMVRRQDALPDRVQQSMEQLLAELRRTATNA